MYLETKFQHELFETMASCDRLGLLYVVQKDSVIVSKWFKKSREVVYRLQVFQQPIEIEGELKHESETEDLSGRPSENQEVLEVEQ